MCLGEDLATSLVIGLMRMVDATARYEARQERLRAVFHGDCAQSECAEECISCEVST